MTNVIMLMGMSFCLMVYALLWTLRKYSDVVHRREVACCYATSWLLMAAAVLNLNTDLRKQLTEHKVTTHAEGIAFALPEVQNIDQSFPRSVSQSEAASGRGTESGRISIVTNGGHFVSVNRDRADNPGACDSDTDSTRSLPAGTGRAGGTDAGVRHLHGQLGTEVTGGCGSTGVLQNCESGVGLKF